MMSVGLSQVAVVKAWGGDSRVARHGSAGIDEGGASRGPRAALEIQRAQPLAVSAGVQLDRAFHGHAASGDRSVRRRCVRSCGVFDRGPPNSPSRGRTECLPSALEEVSTSREGTARGDAVSE